MKSTLPIFALIVWAHSTVAQIYMATPLPFTVGRNVGRDSQGGTPINNAGQIIGFGANGAGNFDGFVYGNGMLTTLGSSLIPIAINESGQITGTSEASASNIGFLYSNGRLTTLGTLGGYYEPHNRIPVNYSFAHSINARGQVIGRSSSPDEGEAPFFYDNGKLTALKIGNSAMAHAINDAGSITGEFFATPGQFHAFLYRNGTVTDLGTLGGSQSFGNAINRADQVTGTADTANGGPRDAFLYAEGAMTNLGSLYGGGGAGYAINNGGQVVGLSRGNSSGALAQTSATMWSGTKIIDLNATLAHPLPDNESLVQAIGINDRGWIVANARAGNKLTAYLLTPVAPLVLACPTAAGEAGIPYSSALTAEGGVPPYGFSNAGRLPGGVVLNTNTGALSGTPREAGSFQSTAQVVDSLGAARGTATANCTITIGPPSLQLRIFPERYSFGTVARFRPRHNTFTIMNTGTRSVSIAKPSITLGDGTNKGDFSATSLCGSSLAPGRSCRIDVVVFAHDVGPLSAILNLPNNAVGSPQTVPLEVTVTAGHSSRGHQP
jgi:probable HAF family extracellular repeat protein